MPSNTTVLYGGAAAYCILLFLQIRMIAPATSALFQAVVATATLALYARMLLRLRGYPNRASQTLAALFVSGAAITLLMLGPTVSVASFFLALGQATSAAEVPQPSAVAMVAYIVIGFWGIAVAAHIYRHALQSSFWLGLAAAMGFEIILLLVFSLLGRL